MTYSAIEGTVDQGEPFFLYLFDDGTTKTRLTSDASDFSGDPEALGSAQTWTASAIAHSELGIPGNVDRDYVNLTFPLSDSFAQTFRQASAATQILTIWRAHHSDTDGEFEVAWKGRVIGGKEQDRTIVLRAESVFTSMRQSGCRARWQRRCRHALYFGGCGLAIADFQVSGTVSAMASDTVLTISAAASEADGWYRLGIVEYDGKFGWIKDHTGDQITLVTPIDGLAAAFAISGSESVSIARGCDRQLNTCTNKFSNNVNHGGFPWLPQKNPFSESFV